jgi:hypothetical protein
MRKELIYDGYSREKGNQSEITNIIT